MMMEAAFLTMENFLVLSCLSLGILFMMIIMFLIIGIPFVMISKAWTLLKPDASEDQDSPLDLEVILIEIEDNQDDSTLSEDAIAAEYGLPEDHLDLEVILLEMEDDQDDSTLNEDFFEAEDGQRTEEHLENPEIHIGELRPRIRKGRILRNKYLVDLHKKTRKLLKDKALFKELISKKGVHIPESLDIIYIEAESEEAKNAIYNSLAVEFRRVQSKM